MVLGAVALALAAVAFPVATGRYPPILDLPQMLAQVDLAAAVVRGEAPEMELRWLSPNKIAYPVLALARWLGGDAWGPRLAVFAVLALGVAGIFLFARRRGRAPEAALLATVWLWSGSLYVGLFHFVLGLLPGLYWLDELTRPRPGGARRLALRAAVGAWLLYLAHALWLAAGLLFLPLALLAQRAPRAEWLARLVGVAPVVALALAWYPSLERGGWGTSTLAAAPLLERLGSPAAIVATFLGGLRGPVEAWLLAALALWVGTGLAAAWRQRRHPAVGSRAEPAATVDHALLATGGALALFALLAPESFGDTALFGRRWAWFAGLLIVLGAPPPPLGARLRRALAALVVAAFAVVTWSVWAQTDRRYLGGLEPLLAAIEPADRVLGLDTVGPPPGLWVPVLRHAGAWAQVERGAEVGFSFAEVPTSLVVYRGLPVRRGWTAWLHNQPERLLDRDLEHFSKVLLAASPADQAAFRARFAGFEPVVSRGPWTLWARARAASPSG